MQKNKSLFSDGCCDMTALIKSKKRVIDHGEVFTPQHIVDDMLDIVADEARRVEQRRAKDEYPSVGTEAFWFANVRETPKKW